MYIHNNFTRDRIFYIYKIRIERYYLCTKYNIFFCNVFHLFQLSIDDPVTYFNIVNAHQSTIARIFWFLLTKQFYCERKSNNFESCIIKAFSLSNWIDKLSPYIIEMFVATISKWIKYIYINALNQVSRHH